MTGYLRRGLILVVLLAAFVGSQALAAEESKRSVGLIVAVNGDVTVIHGRMGKPGMEGKVLESGDTILVKMGASCRGFGIDGEQFSLVGPSEFVLSAATGKEPFDNVRRYIAQQLAQWSGTSRSRSLVSRSVRDWEHVVQSPSPLIPASNGSVRATRARFLWTMVPGVDRYDVTIAPEDGDEMKQTVRGGALAQEDLQGGKSYVWRVEASGVEGSVPSTWSSFRVMTPEDEKKLDEALKQLSDLEAGVLLLSLGLHEEAVYRFDAAAASDDERRSALRWRAQVFAGLGLHKEAYDDLVETMEW